MTSPIRVNFDRPLWAGQRMSSLGGAWLSTVLGMLLCLQQSVLADDYRSRFKPVRPAHYIAALAEPDANSGNNAETWGYWPLDPGPRGVRLDNYEQLLASDGIAPANWSHGAVGFEGFPRR